MKCKTCGEEFEPPLGDPFEKLECSSCIDLRKFMLIDDN